VLLVACAALIAGCGGPTPTVHVAKSTPGGGPLAVAIGPRAAGAPAPGGSSVRAATIVVESGTTSIGIQAADLRGQLTTASTPAGSGQRPVLTRSSDGVIHVQLVSSGPQSGATGLDIQLANSVAWTIELDGGATDETVDMRAGHLALVDLAAGATRVTIDVPAQEGTQRIRELGGASELVIGVPPTVASRVQVNGGAASQVLAGTTHTGIGGSQTFTQTGYETAAQRLQVLLQGGVSSVVVAAPAA